MRSARLVAISTLALLLVPGAVPGQDSSPPSGEAAIDVMKVTPEELRGVDVREIVGRAHEAYREKRYEDAARSFVLALRANPGDSSSLYNLACCFGLLGAADQAVRFLEAAWDAGFRDLGHIRTDPDFDPVKDAPSFKKLLGELGEDAERRAREGGRLLEVASPVVATVRVIEPVGERRPWERMPLVIGLHGLGDNAESFATLFARREIEVPFLYCVPQAPYAFAPGSRLGYSWRLMEDGAEVSTSMRSHRLAERYVLDVLEAVKREYPVDEGKVFLVGFSQGAGMAFTVGLRHPELFRGVIPVGGWLDPGEHRPAVVDRAAKHGRFLVCHSPEDRVVEYSSCEKAVEFLKTHGVEHLVLDYAGGHSLPGELLERIVAWIADPRIPARSGSGSR